MYKKSLKLDFCTITVHYVPLHVIVTAKAKHRYFHHERYVNCWGTVGRLLKFTMEALVIFKESDVQGAKLKFKKVGKNSSDALKRWLLCQGLNSVKDEPHATLVCR